MNTSLSIKALIEEYDIRLSFLKNTTIAYEMIKRYELSPMSAKFFLKALNSSLLLYSLINKEQELSVQWRYPGKIKLCSILIDEKGQFRGFISNNQLKKVPEKDILIDEGIVSVIYSKGGKILHSSYSKAPLLDFTDDLCFFLSTSEQIETRIISDIVFDKQTIVKNSCSVAIQAMPNCQLQVLEQLEQFLKQKKLSFQTKQEIEKLIIEFLASINSKSKFSTFKSTEPHFFCPCNKEKMKATIKTLSKKEREEILAKENKITIHCHYCNRSYSFNRQNILNI